MTRCGASLESCALERLEDSTASQPDSLLPAQGWMRDLGGTYRYVARHVLLEPISLVKDLPMMSNHLLLAVVVLRPGPRGARPS